MLPFTKRPGRENDSGEVVTKDDLEDPPTSLAKRSVPPPAGHQSGGPSPRKLMPSLSDDELTALMPSKSVGTLNPIPAAGRPATIPPPGRTPSVPPPARSSRAPASFDDDGEGRTMVRGAPKVVRRTGAGHSQPPPKMGMPTAPTTISPAAVIKATVDAARAQKRNDIMAGPPLDLLEDRADVHPADAGPQRTVQLDSSQSGVQALGPQVGTQALQPQVMMRSVPPPPASYPGASSAFPPPPASYPPPPMSYPQQQGMSYGAPVASSSVPGVSMPPHFMVPQAPYSDGRIDPPATSITSNHRVAGRPAVSWAAALLAFGLFVGVGAVAVMQNSGDGVVDTTASFVDPARAPGGRAAASPPPNAPTPAPVEAPKPADPNVNAPPPVAVAAPPVSDPNAPPAQPAAPPAVAATSAPPGLIGASPTPVATTPPAPPPPTEAAAKPPEAPKPPQPVATFKPPPRTWSPPPSAVKPAAPASDDSDTPKKTASSSKKGSAKGGGGDDEEMKKALEQLQKSQLEQSLQQ